MIIGLVLVLIGVVVFLLPKPEPEPVAQGIVGDSAKILEEINKMLAAFDKRYRPGMFLVFVGLALVGAGIFLETSDTKDAAEAIIGAPGALGFRSF
jgi:uncharacterized membrane protein